MGRKGTVPAPAAAFLWEPSAVFPDTMLLGSACAFLFAVHAIVWVLLLLLTKQGAAQAHLGAHFVSTFIGFIALAAVGVQGWVLNPPPDMDRTRGTSVVGAMAVNGMVAFQTYEVILAVIAPRLRGKHFEMIGHHVVTLVLAVLGGTHQYVYYYAPFFFGMSEISSVPLTFIDLFKQYKGLSKSYPILNELSRNLFAVSFLALRVVYWPYVCYIFWTDSLIEVRKPDRVALYCIVAFWVANILLTGLQFFWGSLIIGKVVDMLKGKPDDEGKEN